MKIYCHGRSVALQCMEAIWSIASSPDPPKHRLKPNLCKPVFVEDRFAKIWLEAMLRQVGGLAIDHIQVHALQGDGTAVAINLHHNRDPSTNVRSVCFVDGDSRQKASAETGVYRLPGKSPEAFVFDEVLSAWSEFGGKLAVALLQRFENAEAVKDACKSVRLSNRDPHLLFAQLGERLGLLPEATVAAAFANILGASVPLKVHDVLEHIRNLLPTETSDVRQPTKTGETTNHHPAA